MNEQEKPTPKNISMWSGPRNISTALMYAFASRDDCTVWDEPFYAWYLKTTGLHHPMRAEILGTGEQDAKTLIAQCTKKHSAMTYQKHMTQHMLKSLDRSWISQTISAFLIRSPQKVLASFAQKHDEISLGDIGFVQQLEIFQQVADKIGKAPPVVDSEIFLQNPENGLKQLCIGLDIPFSEKMLSWPKGPKPYDGVWAAHWYNAAHQSTGFATPASKPITLTPELARIADQAMPYYQEMQKHAYS